jgi:hypothetical protein
MSDNPPERYVVTLEAPAGEAHPARCSLARLLKKLGRVYNVRCLSVRPADVPAPAAGSAPAGPQGDKPAPEAPKPRRRF